MSKKPINKASNEPKNEEPIEHAFIIKKHSLTTWQIIDVQIQGDKVVSRSERPKDLSTLVMRKLMLELGRN